MYSSTPKSSRSGSRPPVPPRRTMRRSISASRLPQTGVEREREEIPMEPMGISSQISSLDLNTPTLSSGSTSKKCWNSLYGVGRALGLPIRPRLTSNTYFGTPNVTRASIKACETKVHEFLIDNNYPQYLLKLNILNRATLKEKNVFEFAMFAARIMFGKDAWLEESYTKSLVKLSELINYPYNLRESNLKSPLTDQTWAKIIPFMAFLCLRVDAWKDAQGESQRLSGLAFKDWLIKQAVTHVGEGKVNWIEAAKKHLRKPNPMPGVDEGEAFIRVLAGKSFMEKFQKVLPELDLKDRLPEVEELESIRDALKLEAVKVEDLRGQKQKLVEIRQDLEGKKAATRNEILRVKELTEQKKVQAKSKGETLERLQRKLQRRRDEVEFAKGINNAIKEERRSKLEASAKILPKIAPALNELKKALGTVDGHLERIGKSLEEFDLEADYPRTITESRVWVNKIKSKLSSLTIAAEGSKELVQKEEAEGKEWNVMLKTLLFMNGRLLEVEKKVIPLQVKNYQLKTRMENETKCLKDLEDEGKRLGEKVKTDREILRREKAFVEGEFEKMKNFFAEAVNNLFVPEEERTYEYHLPEFEDLVRGNDAEN